MTDVLKAMRAEPRRKSNGRKLHPAALRLMHWINAIATLLMIGSGWAIYNDNPLISWIRFPQTLILGGDPATTYKIHGDAGFGGALSWHFAAMWLLVLNGIAYLIYGVVTGRFRRKLFPIMPKKVLVEVEKAVELKLDHSDITHYNAVQKLLYLGIIIVMILQVTAGLALWKPVQFSGLVTIMGGFQGVRLVHFIGMSLICLFMLVHVALALIVPKTLVAIITGGPREPVSEAKHQAVATANSAAGAPR